ncbi:MAG: HAD-IA family hydrolase [Mariprofundaceae bacterium]|nr:HAD-IA family hydrolase [Mariprofundaceae bacterium]
MAKLKCILWDVDGTLADTERDGHRVAFNMAFEEAGLQRRWDIETYGELLSITGGKERMKYDIKRGGMADMSDETIAALHARKTIHYQTLIADGLIPLRTGVLRLLEEAYAEGITLGISTTTTPAALDALIEHSLGKAWFDRFAVLAAGDIVPAKKPAPDIYNYALEQLGIPAESTLALEDSGNGWLSAHAAGIKCAITINDYTAQQNFEGADLVVSELGEAEHNPIQVLSNPHGLDDLHHITLSHLQNIMVS